MYRIDTAKVIHETIDGETVMVNLDSGNYYSLDGIGVQIWDLLLSGASEGEIVAVIFRRHSGEPDEIKRVVHQFICDLEKEGLISMSDAGESRADSHPGEKSEFCSADEKLFFEAPVLHCYTDMKDLLLLDPIHDVDETGWPSAKSDLPGGQ
jgi:hypothetical protein